MRQDCLLTFFGAPVRFACAVLALAAMLLVWPVSQASAGRRVELPDRLILQVRPGASGAQVREEIARQGGRVVESMEAMNLLVAELPGGKGPKARGRLSRSRRFKFVQPDALLEPTRVPDDPHVADAWHLGVMDLFSAWDVTEGSSGSPIAILDSGVDPDHPDLAGKLAPGWNFYNGNDDTRDVAGHGTLVAGAAAAAGNNGIGVVGPAYANPIMPLRVTNQDGWGLESAIAAGLIWAADHGARVANLSFGGVHTSSAVTAGAQYFMNKGGLVTASAGNFGNDDGSDDNSYMVSVSATAISDSIASWSSFGSYVDVSAPGSGIWTTALGGAYAPASGTSFSAPLTAGVISLIFAVDPTLTPREAEEILEETADDLGVQGVDVRYGWGRVNAGSAVTAAQAAGSPVPDTTAPLATLDSPGEGATVSGEVVMTATAFDDKGVTEVHFFVDGGFVAADANAPYSALWASESLADGPHTLLATAYDDAGNRGDSQAVTVNVLNSPPEPVVHFVNLAEGETVNPNKQIFRVEASGAHPIRHVALLVNGVPAGKIDKRAPFALQASTGKWDPGLYVITARATDAAGNTGETSMTVTRALSEKEKKNLLKKLLKEQKKKQKKKQKLEAKQKKNN